MGRRHHGAMEWGEPIYWYDDGWSDDGWRDDGRRLTGQALKDRAVALLRRSMEKRRRYIIAMCNMAHLLSLNSSTFVEAGLLHLYAREYSGVEEVIEGWNGKWEESSDAASGSSSVAVGGAGRREGWSAH